MDDELVDALVEVELELVVVLVEVGLVLVLVLDVVVMYGSRIGITALATEAMFRFQPVCELPLCV